MKTKLFLTVMAIATVFSGFSQEDPTSIFGTPPQPTEFGKCYAKCKIPDQYETVEEQIPVTSESVKTAVVPSKYETITEEYMVKAASSKYVAHPATYKTVTKEVLVKDGGCEVKYVPAEYESTTNKTLKTAASGEWVRKEKVPNCLSDNPDDCYVLCWVEIPATYEYNVDSKLVRSEKYDTIYGNPVYKTISMQVVDRPAYTEEIQIPAQYKTYTRQRLVECASVNVTTIPGKYRTQTSRVLVKKGGYTNWVEVVCDTDIDASLIRRVQTKLNELGYKAGAADGIMGAGTKAALERYQQDNNLPVGNLNIATMQKLGVQ